MSIKSVRNNLDLSSITIAKQRNPNYIMNRSSDNKVPMKNKYEQIDNVSHYVKENLRGKEHR